MASSARGWDDQIASLWLAIRAEYLDRSGLYDVSCLSYHTISPLLHDQDILYWHSKAFYIDSQGILYWLSRHSILNLKAFYIYSQYYTLQLVLANLIIVVIHMHAIILAYGWRAWNLKWPIRNQQPKKKAALSWRQCRLTGKTLKSGNFSHGTWHYSRKEIYTSKNHIRSKKVKNMKH